MTPGRGDTWQPRIFDPSQEAHRRDVQALRADPGVRVCDELPAQLLELVAIRHPSTALTPAAAAVAIAALVGDTPGELLGRWVYYPWSRALVRCLPPDDFRAVRTNRNQLKILADEQHRLGQARIAIAGLSVGLSVAVTLALEGIGGRFALADFDTLGLSNLNRLSAPLADLGVNKAVLAARRLYELDPFLEIEIFPEGVTDANVEAFLGAAAPGPRLLVEECDDLYMKIRLRERARALRLPVLMETSDAGMLDIERFDLEPERPLLHGLVPGLSADALRGLDIKEKVPIVLRILGADRLAPRTAASLVEIRQTLTTWPQLASAVALGGGLVADAARRVLLGTLRVSGRFYVDLEQLVNDGAPVEATGATPMDAGSAAHPPARHRGESPAVNPDVRFLVEQACLAPSGGNSQPWRFLVDDSSVACCVDPDRASTFVDFRGLGACVALGAAAENVTIAAEASGLDVEMEVDPEWTADRYLAGVPMWRASIRGRVAPRPSASFPYLTRRLTNRRHGTRDQIHIGQRTALYRVAAPAQLTWFESEADLEYLGTLHGRADRLRFLSERMHREVMAELRWTPEEAARTGDGLDLRSLELSPPDHSALRLLSKWPTLSVLKQINGGRALEDLTRKAFVASSAVLVITMPGPGARAYFDGGRVLQRIWLAATAEGLCVHPQGTMVYLLKRLKDAPDTFTAAEREELTVIRDGFRALVPDEGGSEILVLRLSLAEPASARSIRRPTEAVMAVVEGSQVLDAEPATPVRSTSCS